MIDFDYYQIKGKWNAATLNRRAEKLEEAQEAADELEEAGAKGVEIIGVKAGKRETIRGKKKAPKAAKTPKAAKVQAKKKKAAKGKKKQKDKISKMSADDLRAINSIFSHDGKIKILKTNTPKREPAGQLDLFKDLPNKKNTKHKTMLTHDEIEMVNTCLGLNNVLFSAIDIISEKEFEELKKTFSEAEKTFNSELLELKDNEIRTIALALTKEKNRGENSFYSRFKLIELIEFFKKLFV